MRYICGISLRRTRLRSIEFQLDYSITQTLKQVRFSRYQIRQTALNRVLFDTKSVVFSDLWPETTARLTGSIGYNQSVIRSWFA